MTGTAVALRTAAPRPWAASTVGARTGALRWARDPSAALLVAQLVVAGAAFVANILAARALAPAGRGELALLLQIGYLCSLGLLLGTDRSVVAVYTGRRVDVVTRAFLRLLAVPSAVGLLAVLAITALPGLGLRSWQDRLALAMAFAVVNAFVRATRSIAIAAGRQLDYLGCTVVSQGLLLLALVALGVGGVRAVAAWLTIYLVAGAAPAIAWLISWVRTGPGSDPQADVHRRAARREGLQLFPAAVANTGMLRLDRLLLAAMASTAALGVYASVATMTEVLSWPMLTFADSRIGRWRVANDRGELTLRRVMLPVLGYVLAAGVAVGIPLRLLIVPLLGDQYRDAERLVAPLVVAALVFGIQQILVAVLVARRRNTLASFTEIVGFGVSTIAYVALIRGSGAWGAALGSLVGYSAGLLVAWTALGTRRRRGTRPARRPAGEAAS